MRKSHLVEQLAERTGSSKREAERHLTALTDTVTDALIEGDEVSLPGVGRFGSKVSAARTVTNNQGTFDVPARVTPKFKASATLKRTLADVAV